MITTATARQKFMHHPLVWVMVQDRGLHGREQKFPGGIMKLDDIDITQLREELGGIYGYGEGQKWYFAWQKPDDPVKRSGDEFVLDEGWQILELQIRDLHFSEDNNPEPAFVLASLLRKGTKYSPSWEEVRHLIPNPPPHW